MRRIGLAAATVAVALAGALLPTASAGAQPLPDHDGLPQPLPVIVPAPSDWEPKYPFPYDQLRHFVTERDITAERELCQWFNAQFFELKDQIEALNNAIIRHNGSFDAPEVRQRFDVVVANLDQSLAFMTPRAQALTQAYDSAGDMYFPIYQGDAFYALWQQLSNVSNGLKARQPTWFTGPSFLHAQRMGNKISRSHVCD
ncbi:hypothetical protein [Mycolicibacterium elephantis]|uniref:Uncharacterized protein n=1 Tax=Mycolicibacterium elephantis DSM 44368 TaxID=1335622 RepID=A0A439DRE2_9MYCO|nr:hypothetical protein [Mycolicibacterium elephantis]RWA18753.1 hypothetical protein MELE44368_03730 [Mycolicibacterium elephantis DSM 44368]